MSTPSPVPGGPAVQLMSLRILVGALMASLVFITLALFFVLSGTDGAFEVTPVALAPVALGVVSHALATSVGYRVPAIAPGTPRARAEEVSRAAFQAATILRFALTEVVAIVSIAAAFVVGSGGFTVYVVGALVALGLVWWHCWPGERTFARVQPRLERDGGESYLREAYGQPPAGGAVRRL